MTYHGHVNVACMQFHVNLLVDECFAAGMEVGADLGEGHFWTVFRMVFDKWRLDLISVVIWSVRLHTDNARQKVYFFSFRVFFQRWLDVEWWILLPSSHVFIPYVAISSKDNMVVLTFILSEGSYATRTQRTWTFDVSITWFVLWNNILCNVTTCATGCNTSVCSFVCSFR